MILHPGIIALLIGSFTVFIMLLYSSLLGIKIISRWDIRSSSEEQLGLERKTYLVSTIMNYVLGFEILSAIVFIYTVDNIHNIFVGAMCATGSLNANPVGWDTFYMKIIILFLSAIWITINSIDQRAEDYPLVKLKYSLLLIIFPVVVLETYLQFRYFLGINPDIITSCCGALFSETGGRLASSLSSLPIIPMRIAFFSTIGLFVITGFASLKYRRRFLRYAFSIMAVIVFIVSIASVVSFISLYFYEIPTHHCPFDMLQAGYNYIGYPLYITLFGAAFFGMIVGVTEPLRRTKSVDIIIKKSQARWTVLSIVLITVFTIISAWPMIFSSFTLEGYY